MDYSPLFFSFADLISSCDAQAIIEVHGRALMSRQDGLWWITAVCPAGFAAGGTDPQKAFREFRRGFFNIIKDMAEEAEGPEHFKLAVSNFAKTLHEIDDDRWKQARHLIRAGKTLVPEELTALKPIKEEIPVTISVVLVRRDQMKKKDLIAPPNAYSKAA